MIDPGVLSRKLAARALVLVGQGRNLPEALLAADSAALPPRGRAFARRLAIGVVRHQRRLLGDLRPLLSAPVREPLVEKLLLIGLFELEAATVPPRAAVHSAVEAAPARARSLVNAILRRRQREGPRALSGDPAERHSYPAWLATALQADWPELGPDILARGNEEAPLVLRVNRRLLSRAEYADALHQAGISARPVGTDGLVLETSAPLASLPGFALGQVAVQGLAAQQVAPLMELSAACRVLDACAAPGGKTAHMAELAPDCAFDALDQDAARLAACADNFARSEAQVRTLVGDATTRVWWDQQPYDRILLDAPCSGTGVIRRHPDIKWLRRAADVTALRELQRQMLENLWSLLRPGGLLVYTTCSILSAENDAVLAAFCGAHANARQVPFALAEGEATAQGWRVPPGGDWEGFYYARLRKV